MLSNKTIDVIKSTVPVLEEHGETITTHFYESMFKNHPELLNIFNHVNQEQGRQQKALANSVLAAAKYIDNLEAILPVVKQIAHKHRSLGVKAEHYPIVGEHLLAAIKDVLGDAATDEIIDAWAEAYQVIADVFISVEHEMYEEASNQPGGWDDFRPFTVSRIEKESDMITSFYLKPQDANKVATFLPGQYISIKFDIDGETYSHIRQYSLSCAPNNEYYRISVKREADDTDTPDGVVSTFLHDKIQEGDHLEVSAPAGSFFLDTESNAPVALISGGVGLTPMVSMAHFIAQNQPNRPVTFIHAAKNGNLHALNEGIQSLAEKNENFRYFVCYEEPTEQDKQTKHFAKEGFINTEWLQSILESTEGDFYFTGPVPFMKAINKSLLSLGVSNDHIHYEFFGPASDLEE
ncbi:NO-inducible flavohemoprotein [Texcoconibacillus texcoconensis]|uniref:Flavohemoprotein n=1 Tax=Texcoconibacillus texcoconensis TaxID=1095777 RepID=A0A840QRD4_9BACI|nr:NO-inducible flavohemoprotein [Texcoconibacillus texcoconensis]MBB5174026.1 nitric oxide dioxygenase [Texcoconibacillus texcoconensis]